MKRNLLFVSLLAFSGTSLLMSDPASVKMAQNARGQQFLVGPKADGPSVKTSRYKSNNSFKSQELPVKSTKTGWGSWAKSFFTKEDVKVKATPVEYQQTRSLGVTAPVLGIIAASVTGGFTTGFALQYLWDKASTGARYVGSAGLSFAGVMLARNSEARAFAKENVALLALVGASAGAGIFARKVCRDLGPLVVPALYFAWLMAPMLCTLPRKSCTQVNSNHA